MSYYRRARQTYGSADRFPNYVEIDARFDSDGHCGHPIKAGERIGWNRGLKRTRCADCWRRWVAENDAAEADERMNDLQRCGW